MLKTLAELNQTNRMVWSRARSTVDASLYDKIKELALRPNLNAKAREEIGYARGALTMGHELSARKYYETALKYQNGESVDAAGLSPAEQEEFDKLKNTRLKTAEDYRRIAEFERREKTYDAGTVGELRRELFNEKDQDRRVTYNSQTYTVRDLRQKLFQEPDQNKPSGAFTNGAYDAAPTLVGINQANRRTWTHDGWSRVKSLGDGWELWEGTGPNGGDWKAKKGSTEKTFSNRSDAEQHARAEEEGSYR